MKYSLLYRLILGWTFALMLSVIARNAHAATAPLLIKGNGPAVYLVGEDSQRHTFPNEATFKSWYGTTPPQVLTISPDELSAIPLGKNVVMRPGDRLVKIATDPRVYAVSRNGTLRWVSSESLAAALYGTDWNRRVTDIPDVFFRDYQIGSPVTSAGDFDRSAEAAQAPTPSGLFAAAPAKSDGWMDEGQKRRAMEITAVFENSSPVMQYASVVNLHDGRGYTAGRAGFTTGTGDAAAIIERYTAQVPDNPLAKYLTRVQQLSKNESGSVSGLEGYPEAWAKAAKDPIFRNIQDQVVDEIYYKPAMQEADRLGVKSALGRAILFDTIIQHGGGNTSDSLSGIIKRTQTAMGGTPASGLDEAKWLTTFLASRRYVLTHAADADTRAAWTESADRVDALTNILKERNLELSGPILLRLPYGAFVLT